MSVDRVRLSLAESCDDSGSYQSYYPTESVPHGHGCQDSLCAMQLVLVFRRSSLGWRPCARTPWLTAALVLRRRGGPGCSASAAEYFWDIPVICCRQKVGIGIPLDKPVIQAMVSIYRGYTSDTRDIIQIYSSYKLELGHIDLYHK